MTTQLVMVKDLKDGDRVDLEGDVHADPDSTNRLLQHEYQVVESIEQETRECVCVYFTDFVCGFPSEHLVKVRVEEGIEEEA